jgi:hypothetical protein
LNLRGFVEVCDINHMSLLGVEGLEPSTLRV